MTETLEPAVHQTPLVEAHRALGAKLIEVLVGKQSAIPRLPRSNMHARNGQCILRFPVPQQHISES